MSRANSSDADHAADGKPAAAGLSPEPVGDGGAVAGPAREQVAAQDERRSPDRGTAGDRTGTATSAGLHRHPASHRRASRARGAPGNRAQLRAQRRRRLRRVQAVAVVALLAMMVTVRGALFQAFSIPSVSMEPTLEVGDRVLVNKLSYDVGSVQRGQVIVFDGTGSFVRSDGDTPGLFTRLLNSIGLGAGDHDFVKRVIGLPGDRITCCDDQGRLSVNGVALDEPYLYPGDVASLDPFDVQVPPDRLWVMGDHRSRSADSRAHLGDPGGGTVPVDKVVGRAVAIVWPLSRVGWLRIPDSFERLTTNGRAPGD